MTMSRRSNDRALMSVPTTFQRLLDWPFTQVDQGLTELAPPIDVRETNDAYVVEIDLPGIESQDVEVLVEGRTLSVRGKFTKEAEREKDGWLLKERRTGDFVRAIALPGMIDTDGARSAFENGVLTITLPKAAQNRARRIEIGGGKGGQRQVASGVSSSGQQSASGPTGKESGDRA
jgi:HSP20 family protein